MTHKEVYALLKERGGRIRKTFKFGKVAYYNKRKENAVEVEVELEIVRHTVKTVSESQFEERIEFTASGYIWNRLHTDCFSCGQNLDTINELVQDPTFKVIYDLWKKYHLNTMHAGTPEQEEFVHNYFSDKKPFDYTEACKALKKKNLFEVEYKGKPYKYGHGWLYYPIPEKDLDTIVNLLTDKGL